MCGRFTLRTPAAEVARHFRLPDVPDLDARYNIAPSQDIPVIRPGQERQRELVFCRWGLVPFFAKDPSAGRQPINARCETVATSPMFRAAIRRRRCLIPADGFYEWKRVGSKKQPFYIRLKSNEPFAFAGIWERWGENDELQTCALLTTDANELMQPIHDRMPVLLPPDAYELWLDPEVEDITRIKHLFEPYPAGEMEAYAVSTDVNRPTHDAPDCIQPADHQRELF
jgi:putative SOS response-associated peptidase YedK